MKCIRKLYIFIIIIIIIIIIIYFCLVYTARWNYFCWKKKYPYLKLRNSSILE